MLQAARVASLGKARDESKRIQAADGDRLSDPAHRLQRTGEERIGEITEKLAKSGAKFRIKKGQKITGRYKSEQRLEQLAHLNEARQKIDKECGRCHRIKKMVAWRKWCEDCLPAIKSSRNHNEYHEEWYRRRAQDPAWRAERTRKHAEWVKKNAAHLVEYRRQRKEAAATST